ncbi:MAG: hypothetical protein M1817_004857 [Caeruleum heppii]|nr:MAG: hypothetical protein M1817_004857 [Caeruleum heppii]
MSGSAPGDEGATPQELLLEGCRRNNVELLQEVIQTVSKQRGTAAGNLAGLINSAVDGIGNHCLHLAAINGSYDALDLLLDQEGVEVDPIDRFEGDTPLHKTVRFVNGLPKADWESAKAIVEMLIEAGADPKLRNKAKLKAMDLVDPANTDLRSLLQRAEFAMMAGNDVVDEDDDDGPTGSASDSE